MRQLSAVSTNLLNIIIINYNGGLSNCLFFHGLLLLIIPITASISVEFFFAISVLAKL